MVLSDFFKSYVDTEDTPVVMCSMDYKIVYMNPCAVERYEQYGGKDIIGKTLLLFTGEEAKSKVDAVIEWFRESPENNVVFAMRDAENETDIYMIALRDETSELVGFCSKHRRRTNDNNPLYEIS
ncbi:MAG: PAS domain-containing protein [Ruminococcus sp.]|nr:PAS domain-containing protein [Ruminococcus sp.]